MKLRDTVILVVLAHVGLVLIWICMGGCANDKAQEPKEEVAVVGHGASNMEMPPATTEVASEEKSTLILPEPTPITSAATPSAPSAPAPDTSVAKTTEPSGEEITITVNKGDTLWALGRKYHVPVSAIVDRNDIQDSSLIREGRQLIIPVGAAPVESPRPEAEPLAVSTAGPATALPAGSEAVPVAEGAETTLHSVESGETIWILARKYGTTSAKIMEANNITEPTKLQIGRELHIPKGE